MRFCMNVFIALTLGLSLSHTTFAAVGQTVWGVPSEQNKGSWVGPSEGLIRNSAQGTAAARSTVIVDAEGGQIPIFTRVSGPFIENLGSTCAWMKVKNFDVTTNSITGDMGVAAEQSIFLRVKSFKMRGVFEWTESFLIFSTAQNSVIDAIQFVRFDQTQPMKILGIIDFEQENPFRSYGVDRGFAVINGYPIFHIRDGNRGIPESSEQRMIGMSLDGEQPSEEEGRVFESGLNYWGILKEGQLVSGMRSDPEGMSDRGTYVNGELEGENCERTDWSGLYRRGTFKEGQLNGPGFQRDADGLIQKGIFRAGFLISGSRSHPSGMNDSGTYVNGQLEGENCERTDSSGVYRKGAFKNGQLHGQGFCQQLDGIVLSGRFEDGNLHGPGTMEVQGYKVEGVFNAGMPEPDEDEMINLTLPNGNSIKVPLEKWKNFVVFEPAIK